MTAGKSRYMMSGPLLTLAGATIPAGSQNAVYVDGDVYITNDITFTAGAGTQAQLPYFALIVSGNIYISPTVKRIDGMYIAQPRNLNAAAPSDGRIYTCAPGGTAPTPANVYSSCSTEQLVVNGALVAQQVKFMRTYKTLREAVAFEEPNSIDGAGVVTPDYATGSGTNAAEVINYTPEMYLATSPLRDPGQTSAGSSGLYGKYDAIFSLPPVY